MAIYRCKQCNFVTELDAQRVGEDMPCPQCQHVNKIWDSTFFVNQLLEKYFALHRSYQRLQNEQKQDAQKAASPTRSEPLPTNEPRDFSNTAALSEASQAQALLRWFEHKRIKVELNPNAVDTTGFFDEIAHAIATDYATLRPIIQQICHAYRENYIGTTIHLANRNADELHRVTQFCRQLHEFAFISRLVQQKSEKTLRLILQPSPPIRQFFSGIWLEWYALMQALSFASQRQLPFSCARNLKITLPNAEVHELDVFLLLDDKTPICIECKTGEYHSQIEKYRLLKKSLGLQKAQFLLCVADISDEHAQGFTSIYDLTFTNPKHLLTYLQRL